MQLRYLALFRVCIIIKHGMILCRGIHLHASKAIKIELGKGRTADQEGYLCEEM